VFPSLHIASLLSTTGVATDAHRSLLSNLLLGLLIILGLILALGLLLIA